MSRETLGKSEGKDLTREHANSIADYIAYMFREEMRDQWNGNQQVGEDRAHYGWKIDHQTIDGKPAVVVLCWVNYER